MHPFPSFVVQYITNTPKLIQMKLATVVALEYGSGYLSTARCRLAYGPADATATHCLLLQ